LLLSIGAILGSAVGYGFFYNTPKLYLFKITAHSRTLNDTRVLNMIGDLDLLAEKAEYQQLASKLNLTKAEAMNIGSITCLSNYEIEKRIKAKQMEFQPIGVAYTFEISALVQDLAMFEKLKKGIFYYLENNEFSKLRNKIHVNDLKALIAKVNSEMQKLDSTNTRYVNNLITGKAGQMILNNPGDFRMQLITLYEKKLQLESQLQTPVDVELLQDYIVIHKAVSPKLSYNLMSGFILGLALAFGIILFRRK
jgi:hypothetical protein